MKFFFPELGFCFGGTAITPPAEIICSDVSTTRRRVRHGKFTKHWKPELSAIAEDGHMRRQSHDQSVSVVRAEKKPLNKTRSSGRPRSHSYSSGDYRKFTQTVAIPAFSPTPFVF